MHLCTIVLQYLTESRAHCSISSSLFAYKRVNKKDGGEGGLQIKISIYLARNLLTLLKIV